MKKIRVLIIGYGSSGRRYAKLLKYNFKVKDIYVVTNNTECEFKRFSKLNEVKKLNFDLVIISSETHKHYSQLKFIENNFSKKKIIVEKPLFSNNKKLEIKNNKVFVGYNLRFDPIIKLVKKRLLNQKIISCNLNCFSFLPNWRKDRKYSRSYSALKLKGGGVTRDLSHEIDLAFYLADLKKIIFARNSKISNLKISSDDIAFLLGQNKRKTLISINLNFSYHIEIRQIFINTNKESIFIDILNRNLVIKNNLTQKKIKFKKNNIKNTYYELLKDVILNKKTCCSFQEGMKINTYISKFKKI